MTAMLSEPEFHRLKWDCRRGLLENDLILERFLRQSARDLLPGQLQAFRRLLEFNDNDLWDLMSGRAECTQPELAEVLTMLRSA